MKRILLAAFLCFIGLQGSAQTIIGLYGGAGCATKYNYDVAPSGGLELLFEGHRGSGLFIGGDLFYQAYSLYADNEANSAKNGTGYAGTIDRFKTGNVFLAPKFSYHFDKTGNFRIYAAFGVGYNISGFDSLHKFDHGYYTNGYYTNPVSGTGQYDSVIDKSKNINKLILRGSVGMTEYIHMGGKWFFSFTEDFGFVTKSLTSTGTSSDGSRTTYSTTGLRPGYISLQIGISHRSLRKRD